MRTSQQVLHRRSRTLSFTRASEISGFLNVRFLEKNKGREFRGGAYRLWALNSYDAPATAILMEDGVAT